MVFEREGHYLSQWLVMEVGAEEHLHKLLEEAAAVE